MSGSVPTLGLHPTASTPEYQPGDTFTTDADTTLYAVWFGPDLTMPGALTDIQEEAFIGGAFRYVVLPQGVKRISSKAFAYCPNLKHIYIPEAATTIATDAFEGVTGLTIHGADGSYAEFYAGKHGFTFIAE